MRQKKFDFFLYGFKGQLVPISLTELQISHALAMLYTIFMCETRSIQSV